MFLINKDLRALLWAPGQFFLVENYWEAAGVMAALKEGIAPESVRRPLVPTTVMKKTTKRKNLDYKNKEVFSFTENRIPLSNKQ